VDMGSPTVVSGTSITATIPAGVSGLVDVSVAGATKSGAVTVTPLLNFVSDWSSHTGTGDDAVLDSHKTVPWMYRSDPNTKLAVVEATELDFPTANVLRVKHVIGAQGAGSVELLNVWPLPAIDGSLYMRWYYRSDIANTEAASNYRAQHPMDFETLQAGNLEGMELVTNGNKQNGYMDYRFSGGTGIGPPYSDVVPGSEEGLPKFQTWRIEVQMMRVGVDSWRMDAARIYNSSNVLIYSGADGIGIFRDGSYTLLDDWPAGGDGTFVDQSYRQWRIGTNGGSWTFVAEMYEYYGGVAVSSVDWCGPYVAGEHT
jgi:hypothetical protein